MISRPRSAPTCGSQLVRARPAVPISIDNATARDFPLIGNLNVAAYREFAPRIAPAAWRTMQTNLRMVESTAQRATFLIARLGPEIVGSVAYCPAGKSDPAIFPPDWASLLLLAVAPQHRGSGIATELVTRCLQRARADGTLTVGLFTSELMTTAHRLYERLGFKLAGEIPRRYGLKYWRYQFTLAYSDRVG